ncbi:MAG: AMP-binding protein [Planctomycetota bacterium]|nr:AMP-binding protein [Planctomycetota bacterium]
MVDGLLGLLERVAAMPVGQPFVGGRSGTLDGPGFAARARELAAGMRAAGGAPGDRVVGCLEHDVDLAVFPFACAWLGALSVLVNPRLKIDQVRHIIGDADPALVLLSPARRTGLGLRAAPDLAGAVPLRTIGPVDGFEPLDLEAPRPEPVPDASGPTTILYTSGSTGQAKGIVQSGRSLADGARIVAGYLGLTSSDHVLGVLPLSFDYGLNQVLAAAHSGCRLTLLSYLFAADVAKKLRDLACTGLAGVPELWVDVVDALENGVVEASGLRALRYVTNSGGRLPERVIQHFDTHLPWVDVFSMYGLTEAFRSSFVPPAELRRGRRGIGFAMPGVVLDVVDLATGRPCAPGEVGELVHRGACVAEGYWQKPELTVHRFRPDETGLGPRAVHSGDLARRDADGYLELLGRADEQLKIGGYRVSPDEVVDVVRAVDGVVSAAAVGVMAGLDGLPQLCVLVQGAVDGASVVAACRSALPPWMVPARVSVQAGPLPLGPNGKVDLAAVRGAFVEGD